MRIRPIFARYDLWIGLYWDSIKQRLYFLPLPCIGICIDLAKPTRTRLANARPMSLTEYHQNNAVGRPEFMHIRGAKREECPGCLYVMAHGKTPHGTEVWVDEP